MCPVVIREKVKYAGEVTVPAINVETVVVSLPAQSDEYMVEGYLDVAQLAEGDALLVTEYIALDGVNFRPFTMVVYQGPVDEPVVRFHTKTLPAEARYMVAVTQLTGVPRSIRYVFIVELLGVG